MDARPFPAVVQPPADGMMEPLSSRPVLGPGHPATPLSGSCEALPESLLFSPFDPLHLWPNAHRHSSGAPTSVAPRPDSPEHTALGHDQRSVAPAPELPLPPLSRFSLGRAEAVDRYARLPDMPPLPAIEMAT